MSAKLEVTVLGVGDAFTAIHHTTSLLVSYDGVTIGIDCPGNYRRVLRDAELRIGRALPAVDHVLITHVHGDHMNGLEAHAFFEHFVLGRRASLLCADEVRKDLWDGRLRAPMSRLFRGGDPADAASYRPMSFDDYFACTRLRWDAPIELGPFRIHARPTIHHVPTSAIAIEAGGKTFAYSADTAFDPQLIAFLERADLVFHETNYGPAHTPYESLAALPERTREKMRLVHYPDAFDIERSNIRVAHEGDVLVVE